jgi:hypothetical protein
MGLPASQRHALGSIEARLRAADPHLASMFAMFSRLSVGEPVAMERLVSRPGLRLPPPRLAACAMVLIPVMFIALVIVSARGRARVPIRSAAARPSCGPRASSVRTRAP